MSPIRHSYGALELVGRYDFIRNRDLPSADTRVCAPALGHIPARDHITRCEIGSLAAGLNYYFNPRVRLMLNWDYATYDLGEAGKDHPKAVNARFEYLF